MNRRNRTMLVLLIAVALAAFLCVIFRVDFSALFILAGVR